MNFVKSKNFVLIFFFFFLNIKASDKIYNILKFGAIGNGIHLNTKEINQAIIECNKNGGGTILIPKGKFLTGTITLLSNVNIKLESGAEIIGSKKISDYMIMPDGYYYSGINYAGIFFGNNIENISISGNGKINGNASFFMNFKKRFRWSKNESKLTRQGVKYMVNENVEDGPVDYEERPGHLITISNSRNIEINDLYLKDSPKWTIRIGGSENININQIVIDNNLFIPNNDGIHITSSRNVKISKCDVRAGDDAIIVTGFSSGDKNINYKFGNKSKISENIKINDCKLKSRSSAIRVGYGENAIKNVVIKNIIIDSSNRGIGIFSRNNSLIENIVFKNIKINTRIHSGGWWGRGEPIHISSIKNTNDGIAGSIKNIYFSNITANSGSGILIYAEKNDLIKNIKFKKIDLTLKNGPYTKKYGGNIDIRPSYSLDNSVFKFDISAFYGQNIKTLEIKKFTLKWGDELPNFYTHAIELKNFSDLIIQDFFGYPGPKNQKLGAIKLSNGYKILLKKTKTPIGYNLLKQENLKSITIKK